MKNKTLQIFVDIILVAVGIIFLIFGIRDLKAKIDESKVDVEFLVYYFHTTPGQKKILSFANYVGVPALSQPLPNFKDIEVDFPDIDTQHRIVKILNALETKIANNAVIASELENLAKKHKKKYSHQKGRNTLLKEETYETIDGLRHSVIYGDGDAMFCWRRKMLRLYVCVLFYNEFQSSDTFGGFVSHKINPAS